MSESNEHCNVFLNYIVVLPNVRRQVWVVYQFIRLNIRLKRNKYSIITKM